MCYVGEGGKEEADRQPSEERANVVNNKAARAVAVQGALESNHIDSSHMYASTAHTRPPISSAIT